LVEDKGYFSSLYARFEQARRHSQGVVELGYVLLQYTRLMGTTGFSGLPMSTHAAIVSIEVKIHTLHITSTAQCFALIVAAISTILPGIVRWVLAGGISAVFEMLFQGSAAQISNTVSNNWDALNFAQQALAASLGQVSGVTVLYSVVCFFVIRDLIDGSYYKVLGRPNIVGAMPPVGEDDETAEAAETETLDAKEGSSGTGSEGTANDSALGTPMPAFVTGPFSMSQSIGLLLHIPKIRIHR